VGRKGGTLKRGQRKGELGSPPRRAKAAEGPRVPVPAPARAPAWPGGQRVRAGRGPGNYQRRANSHALFNRLATHAAQGGKLSRQTKPSVGCSPSATQKGKPGTRFQREGGPLLATPPRTRAAIEFPGGKTMAPRGLVTRRPKVPGGTYPRSDGGKGGI